MNKQFDLIVIGAGTTGIPCAVEAANLGAKVLLLEKSHEVGIKGEFRWPKRRL